MELMTRQETWNITYNHALGETASWFYAQIRDNAKIYGRRCAKHRPRAGAAAGVLGSDAAADDGMGRGRARRPHRGVHHRL